jgi:hypothetical protein
MDEDSRRKRREDKLPVNNPSPNQEEIKARNFAEFTRELVNGHLNQDHYDLDQLLREVQEFAHDFSTQVQHDAESQARPSVPLPREGNRRDERSRPTDVPRERSRREPNEHSKPATPKKSVHYDGASKVALQRFRDEAIREGHPTNIPDQGIRFDEGGFPYERHSSSREPISPGPSRATPPERGGRDEPPGGGDPGGPKGGDDDGDSSPSGGSHDEEDDSFPPTDGEEDFEETSLLRPNSRPRSRSRTAQGESASRQTPSGYTTGTHRSRHGYLGELDSYRDKGVRRPSKYLKAMHSKFHKQIDNKVSVAIVHLPDRKNGPRVPTPPNYGGSTDTEVFERWLNVLLRWLRVNKVCGPEHDSERIEYTSMYLEDSALTWFEDNVDGVYRH